MKNYFSLALLFIAWLTCDTAYAQHEHVYENGICRQCPADYEWSEDARRANRGRFESPVLNADSVYELRNAGNVEWIADVVNLDTILNVKVKMMNDIDFEGTENLHMPIGNKTATKFDGEFDGQGFRIKNLVINKPEATSVGFFGFMRGNGEDVYVRNLIIDKTCSFVGAHRVGAVTGSSQNAGATIYFQHIVNEASVTAATGTDAGGLIGGSEGNATYCITNCVNAGRVSAGGYAGALAGYIGGSASNTVTNFLNIGEIVGSNNAQNIARNVKLTNAIDLSESPAGSQGIRADLTPADLATGKVTFVLNGDQTNILFYQTIGTDAYPMPFSTSKQVYFDGTLFCDGTLSDGNYSNTPCSFTKIDHKYDGDDYYCTECGQLNLNYCTLVDGYYQIGTPNQLMWFGTMINNGNPTLNAVLTADLDFAELPSEKYVIIGRPNLPFKGTFDGQYHTISNYTLVSNEERVGIFGVTNGGVKIRNLRMDETCSITGSSNVGMIGWCANAGDAYYENLGYEGTITATGGQAGAILGVNNNNVAVIHLTNCYMTGHVKAASNAALIAGGIGNLAGNTVTGCWASGTVEGKESELKEFIRYANAKFTNCYSISGKNDKVTLFGEEEIANGSLCYKLNGDQSKIAWFQNIDKGTPDEHPTFMPDHNTVYAVAEKKCDGSFDPEKVIYSNNDESVIPDHEFEDGFCRHCGYEDSTYHFLRVFPNADHNAGGGYTSNNSQDGSKL
ncbi:MAG: hypothetical protein HUK03_08480, partial [Bacteroidaceae bacterium]|nr:hypothetical protein [Bacteroidaceae bacterium]